MAFPANIEVDEETGEITKELDDPDLLQNRPALQRALVISGKRNIIIVGDMIVLVVIIVLSVKRKVNYH